MMKTGWTILSVVVVCGIGVLAWSQGTAAVANGEAVIPAASPSPEAPPSAGDEKTGEKKSAFSYVGSKSCKKCHLAVHKSWAKTKMGKAFDLLKPGQAAESKTQHKLDPNKDYTQDKECLECHTTGFGEKGGYAIPDPSDKKAVRKAKKLEGVGCECCHGPGSEYSKVFKEILKSKRKYKVEELYAVGLRKIDGSACTDCHNDKSPFIDTSKSFDFAKDKDKDAHEHKPLKQRDG